MSMNLKSVKLDSLRYLFVWGLGFSQVSCQNGGQEPPAFLRPQGTTNWADLSKWERKDFPAMNVSVELPKARSTEDRWNDLHIAEPTHATRGTSFSLHQASAGFLMEPQSKISVFIEHYYTNEWQEYLARKRHTLARLGDQPRGVHLGMMAELDTITNRYEYRKDYKLLDGSVIIASAQVKHLSDEESRRGRPDAEDDAVIRRILNSVRPL